MDFHIFSSYISQLEEPVLYGREDFFGIVNEAFVLGPAIWDRMGLNVFE